MRYIFYLCFIISGLFPIYALQAQDNTICVHNDIKLEKVALWRDTYRVNTNNATLYDVPNEQC